MFFALYLFSTYMSNATCDLSVYLQSEVLIISWIYPGAILFLYFKTVFAIQYPTLYLAGSQHIFESVIDWYRSLEITSVKKEYIRFGIFEICFSNLTLTLSCIKCWKMDKLTLKMLPYEHHNIFKVCLAIFQYYAWKS